MPVQVFSLARTVPAWLQTCFFDNSNHGVVAAGPNRIMDNMGAGRQPDVDRIVLEFARHCFRWNDGTVSGGA